MRARTLVVSFVVAAMLSGCAAMFNKPSETIRIASIPSGASVRVNGHPSGVTPLSVELSTRRDHVIRFDLPGYRSTSATLRSAVGADWVVLDILALSLLAIIIDAATESWYELDQNSVNVSLRPLETPAFKPIARWGASTP